MAKNRTPLDPWTDASVSLNGAITGLESAVSSLIGKTELVVELSLLYGQVVFLRSKLVKETGLKRREFGLETSEGADDNVH